jgi:hypothetical protein
VFRYKASTVSVFIGGVILAAFTQHLMVAALAD